MRSRSSPGRLVVVEGIDGSGKTRVVRGLARRLRRRGLTIEVRREPHDRKLGRAALELAATDPREAAALFTLDRLLARPSIGRALGQGRVVLQDRSYYSTLVYQGTHLPAAEARALARRQRRAAYPPDRVIWLDVSARVASSRIHRRGGRRERVERIRSLERLRKAYERFARSPRWVRIDADRSPEAVLDEVEVHVAGWLTRRAGRPPRRR